MKPKLMQIRTAVRQGRIGKVYRLFQKFTGDYTGINPIEENCKAVLLQRVCTNGLVLVFICEEMNISMTLYNYPQKRFVKPYTITKSIKYNG